MRKTKKDYYANINKKDVIDNKKFWKTVKPLFSDMVKSFEKIKLVHEDKIITTDDENAKVLNSSFSNVVKHLKFWNSDILIFQQNASLILLLKQ